MNIRLYDINNKEIKNNDSIIIDKQALKHIATELLTSFNRYRDEKTAYTNSRPNVSKHSKNI